MDDISLDSVKPALKILNCNCKIIGNIRDNNNDFAIFLKNPPYDEISASKKIFNDVKNYVYPKE